MASSRAPWRSLAVILAGSGVIHLVKPDVYKPLIPRQLGRPEPWVLWSGVAELVCAAALVPPRTRPLAARTTAALFVGVFPGNVKMAVDALGSPKASPVMKAVAVARLPLQAPLIAWARRAGR